MPQNAKNNLVVASFKFRLIQITTFSIQIWTMKCENNETDHKIERRTEILSSKHCIVVICLTP